MSREQVDKRAFKSILRSIASDELSPDDYAEALADLRSGSMISLLDDIFAALAGEEGSKRERKTTQEAKKSKSSRKGKSTDPTKPIDTLFSDIKRRKISRARLDAIVRSISSEFARQAKPEWTIREFIANFQKNCSERQWDILSSIVNGEFEKDSYLDDIASS